MVQVRLTLARLGWIGALLVLLGIVMPDSSAANHHPGAPVPHPSIIDNGSFIQLGIQLHGHLNVGGGTPSMEFESTELVGLRYIPTNGEATAAGCLCEGWGVSADAGADGTFAGYANLQGGTPDDGGPVGLVLQSGTGLYPGPAGEKKAKAESVGTRFRSIVKTTNGRLRVTHDFFPSPLTNKLYQVDVTIENTGPTVLRDVRYRRVMDWDVAPFAFSEWVEIHVGSAANLLRATTDGFQSANPLSTPGPDVGVPPTTLTPGSPDYVGGPTDQGALFDFTFGSLAPGGKRTFRIFYGAARTRAEARIAVTAVGGEAYSFGIPRGEAGGRVVTGPHVFIFAFSGVGGNAPPVADEQSVTTTEDTPVAITLTATDEEPGALTLVVVTPPSHGTLTGTPPNVTYTPNPDFNGTDTFQFIATDAGKPSGCTEGSAGCLPPQTSTPATVTVTVNPGNAVGVNDAYATQEDTALTVGAPGVLGNDGNPGPGSLTAQLVTGPANAKAFTLNADGSFTYTPKDNFNGADSFTYQAKGSNNVPSNIATVAITVTLVNDAPVAQNDAYSTSEDTTLTAPTPGVLGNDTDVDGGSLTAVLLSGPAHGTLALNANGSFAYTPAANYHGPDAFTYQARDASGALSNIATVDITVVPANDAPVAQNDSYVTNEDTALSVPAPGVLGNDTDADGDSLTVVLVSGPSHGTLALNANGSFTYVPTANYNGPDGFTYQAKDPSGALSSVATVAITVNAVDDAPAAQSDGYTTNENQSLTVAAPGVLANDGDVDNPTLTAVLITGPLHGTVTLNANGSFTYVPNQNFDGVDTFTYVAKGGASDSNVATVTINVVALNHPPFFDPIFDQSVSPAVGTTESLVITGVAPGPPEELGQVLAFTATSSDPSLVSTPTITGSGSTRTLTYQRNSALTGTATITVTAQDNAGGPTDTFARTFAVTLEAAPTVVAAVTSFTANPNPAKPPKVTVKVTANPIDFDGDGQPDCYLFFPPRPDGEPGNVFPTDAETSPEIAPWDLQEDTVEVCGTPLTFNAVVDLSLYRSGASGTADLSYTSLVRDPELSPTGDCPAGSVCAKNIFTGEKPAGSITWAPQHKAGIKNTVIIRTIDRVTGRTVSSPFPDITVRVFDITNPELRTIAGTGVTGFFRQVGPRLYVKKSAISRIYEIDKGRVGTCKSDAAGICFSTQKKPLYSLIIAKFVDRNTGQEIYFAAYKRPADFVNFVATAQLILISHSNRGFFQDDAPGIVWVDD